MELGSILGWACFAAVIGTCVLLLAIIVGLCLPQSPLRDVVNRIIAGFTAIGLVCLTASPIDIVPDVIPVAGWVDDIGYVVGAYAAARYAIKGPKRNNDTPELPPS